MLAVYVGSNLLNLQFITCDNNTGHLDKAVVRFSDAQNSGKAEARSFVDSLGGKSGS